MRKVCLSYLRVAYTSDSQPFDIGVPIKIKRNVHEPAPKIVMDITNRYSYYRIC